MFFDRYGIHIQAFVDFINGKLSFSFLIFVKYNIKYNINYDTQNGIQTGKKRNTWYLGHTFSTIFGFL